MPEPEYLTVTETAELLRIDPDTVRAGIRRGEIHATRIGRTIRIPRGQFAASATVAAV